MKETEREPLGLNIKGIQLIKRCTKLNLATSPQELGNWMAAITCDVLTFAVV